MAKKPGFSHQGIGPSGSDGATQCQKPGFPALLDLLIILNAPLEIISVNLGDSEGTH